MCAPTQFINFRAGGALPVQADRIKWRYPPSFDPAPYLSPALRHAYECPDSLRRPLSDWPPAKLHCSRSELLKLGRKWDDLGAVRITPASDIDWSEAVGIFTVSKSATQDRLIINPTVCNSRTFPFSQYSKTLALGCLLTLLSLEQEQGFRFCADDLSDYYYTYKVSPERAACNSFCCKFEPEELAEFQAAKGLRMVGPQLLSLATMAMGDCLSVEVGQSAHMQVLRQHAGAFVPSETLLYRQPVPNTSAVELLAIDDHIVLQKLPLKDIPKAPPLRNTQIFQASGVAYDRVGLVLNDDKKRRNLTRGVILGAELDGERGVIGPPRQKTLSLALLTSLVAKRGHATRELLDRILGCWVHAMMFRRPVFAVVDHLFREGSGLARNISFRLSSESRNELLMLACLCPALLTDLRVPYDDQLFCLDASPTGGAVCSTTAGPQASAEMWRHGELRGYHTRLQSEVSELLFEKGIAHASEDLFGAHGTLPADLQPFPKLDP